MNMDNLFIDQTNIYESMNKLFTNFKKDGAERKTFDYCKRKIDLLEAYWREYLGNHEKLCEFGDSDHVYFRKHCFKTAEGVYISAKELFNKTIVQLEKSIQVEVPHVGRRTPDAEVLQQPGTSKQTNRPSFAAAGDSKLGEMLRKQKINLRAFMRTVSSININQLNKKWEFEDALKSLESRWSIVDNLHWQIEGEDGGEDLQYQDEFCTHEELFIELKKNINTKMWSVAHREKSTPQIDIPVFNGNYHAWISFKDLFTEAIHSNPSMSNAQKMQFLKGKVTGEAERLIHHLQISSDNYEVCWDILNHRYGNKKLVFTSHINILLGLPTMQQQSFGMIKNLHDVTKECLHAIQNLGVDITSWDPLLVHLLAQKLDNASYTEYVESMKKPRELPVLQEFLDFLENKFTTLEASRRKQTPINQKPTQLHPFNFNHNQNQKESFFKNNYRPSYKNNSNFIKPNMNSLHVSRSSTCVICNDEHGLWQCSQFLQMSHEQRMNIINKFKYCVNCLTGHPDNKCMSSKRCRRCLDSHNTLLHEAMMKPYATQPSKPNFKPSNKVATNDHASRSSHVSYEDMSEILLATAMVKVTGADGTIHMMRVLVDQGSQISLINENAAQILGLQRRQCKGKIFGVGIKENSAKGMIDIDLQSIHSDFSLNVSVIIMNNLIKGLPNKTFIKPSWSHIQNINLADPEFNISRSVDMLLGADVYSKIILSGILKGDGDDQPIAQQTQLGWLLCGTMTPRYNCNVVLHNTNDLLRFWEDEDINQHVEMSSDDHECLQYFMKTTRRLQNGRYEVRLPFKNELKEKLGATKPQAIAQFYNLEKKLLKNQSLQADYKTFMQEYLKLNHMAPSTNNVVSECYLPHHAVTRDESTTTKLRVVFNASAKSSSGYSLNDVMYRGPNLQQDLQQLILKWRQYQYVFTADIEKMYRQIMVHPDDQAYQKILWRNTPKERVQAYQLTTVSYGTKPAGWLAMMCLRQLAADERRNFPEAAKELESSFYMDDFCGGSHSIDKANKLKSDLITILHSAGFNLRKWTSNKPELLKGLDVDQRNQPTFEFKQLDSTKTLGLGWNPYSDMFIFESKVKSQKSTTITKRTLLSDISKLFDPLGWLTPISTTMKILFQKVWLSKLEWDEKLPEDIHGDWLNLKQELKDINTMNVNRWLGTTINQRVELHGFCDASNKAYACVIYCKVANDNRTTITLVAAKARLRPINKVVTTPRLELMGAQLLSLLMQKVQNCLTDYQLNVHCWSDSTAVLGWIHGDPARWKPFVSNRVKSITKIIPAEQWHYVKTEENPADCASRGLPVNQLRNHTLWWQGPSWLPSHNQYKKQTIFETNLEAKASILKQSNAVTVNQDDATITSTIINHLLHKFDSITKIIRIFAWILRLTTYKKQVHRPYLTLHELRRAKMLIIKTTQQKEFVPDLHHIRKHGQVHCKSNILNLNPFIDEDGVLRVGGRLRNAQICSEMKHPVILPHNHRLTILLISQAHELTFHGGARITLANLRKQYWVINGYMATKKFTRQCVTCKKHEPARQYQLMGDLPASRVNPENAFYHCGVDYTGFVEVKANKGRGIKTTKGYIAIFVCMVTKAVHIELVSDLSSPAFLAALNRMAARRGAPRHIYSDNGTNFLGANRMLQEEYQQLQQVFSDSFLKEVTEMGIEWHFNIPSWPSAGGLWERAVRSLKHHLKRVIGCQKLTFEEYSTLLAKVEACLNSRPLCALTEDPEDLDFLTPAHFLSGRPGLTMMETEQDARTRWHLTQKIFQDLWRRWKTEYLAQLSSRNKWLASQRNITVGDLVVIQDDNLPAGRWAMGRVLNTHPGDDGLVRAVTLKTKNGLLKRPIIKLSVLPIRKEDQNADQPTRNHIPLTPEPKKQPDILYKSPKERKGRRRSKFTSIATALYCFMMLVLPTYGLHDIKQIPDNQTLYFDPISKIQLIRDKWTLVVYYDMEPYWAGIKAYDRLAQYLNKLCNNMEAQTHCNMIIQQNQHDYQELDYYNELLLTQHFEVPARQRRRRGLINGVGYLANDLFGVLDSRFAEQYARDIDTIRHNEQHLSNLWKNQTSVIEAEFNLMKRMEITVDKQHKIVNKRLQDLQDNTSTLRRDIRNITYVQEFILSAMGGNSLLQSLKRLQDTLLDTITDIYHGQVSMHLLTPTQLKNELHTIYSKMPGDLTLPIKNIDTDLHYIYKLIKIKARATQRYIIIEVIFPLISREDYQLYKIIPVPHQINTSMVTITPTSQYVAVNLKKDSYFSMTISELTACLYQGETYMCQLLKPVLTIKNDESFCDVNTQTNKCKVEKLPCANKWVELHSPSQYFYFCCDAYTIKIICEDQVTARQLSRAGVIGISSKCIIKGKDFSLYSLQHQSNQINFSPTIYVPEFDQMNSIIDIKIPTDTPIEMEDGNLNSSMTSLGEAVKELKASNAAVDDISVHDIHHYVTGYLSMSVALVAAIVYMWRSGRCRPCRRPAAPVLHDIRLEELAPRSAARARDPRRPHEPPPAPPLPATTSGPTHGVVLDAGALSESDNLHRYALRWPSVRHSPTKKDQSGPGSSLE